MDAERKPALRLSRLIWNHAFTGLTGLLLMLAVLPLFLVFGYVIYKGLPGLNLQFFTLPTTPTGIPGGMSNAIVGSLEIVGVASLISIPLGIGAGIFMSEMRAGWFKSFARFLTDVLSGVPSIVVGLLAYAIVVKPMGGFSGISGSVALAILMIPVIARATDQALQQVPVSIREGGWAVGARQAQVWLRIVLPTAIGGVVTGFLLAFSRVLGETAPLLFTAFGNQFWATNMMQPVAAVPLQIFEYALSPYSDWQQEAWTGSLVLVIIALIINLITRLWVAKKR